MTAATRPPMIDKAILNSIYEGYPEQHGDSWLAVVGDYYVMTGPSGLHSLLVSATDLDRLNAHWYIFASHPINTDPGTAPASIALQGGGA